MLHWRPGFFAGDLGQRIFQQPFSWKSLGVDIRGRSRTLRINYRTSHQIRQQADRLLGDQSADVDGNIETRSDTISVFNGPPPLIQVVKSDSDEINAVGAWLAEQTQTGVLPQECGVFVRSEAQFERAKAAVTASGLAFKVLDEHVETISGHVSIITMHLAKGLEFRAVVVMACDDEVIASGSAVCDRISQTHGFAKQALCKVAFAWCGRVSRRRSPVAGAPYAPPAGRPWWLPWQQGTGQALRALF